MIDSHTHLDATPGEDSEIVARAKAAGVRRILTVGTNEQRSATALVQTIQFDGVMAAVGLHPNDTTGFNKDTAKSLAELAAAPRCCAVGETGLDYFRDTAPRADQYRAFQAHIEIARATKKTLIIHTRAADDDTITILKNEAPDLTVVLHCFSMPDRLDECLEQGWHVSFAGNVTYPKNQALAAAAQRAPLDRLLVETDAPYLSPQVVRKEKNQAANVVHTARFIAELRGMDYADFDAAVEANFAELFGW